MTARKQPEPWPLWGRILFWVLFGGVVLAGLVTTVVTGDFATAALRVTISAVVVPGIVLGVVALVNARRIERRRHQLTAALNRTAAGIDAERRRFRTARPTGASDESLQKASLVVVHAQQWLRAGDLEQCVRAVTELSGVATAWRPDAPLTQLVAYCAGETTRLQRRMKVAEQTAR
ncbi:hypothetical protein [Calidifontibacter terrae]